MLWSSHRKICESCVYLFSNFILLFGGLCISIHWLVYSVLMCIGTSAYLSNAHFQSDQKPWASEDVNRHTLNLQNLINQWKNSSCKIYFKKLWNIIIFQNYFIIYKLFLSWIIKKSKLLLLDYCCLFLCWTICFQTSCAQKYQVIPNHSACLQKTAIATDSGKVCLSVCLSLLLSFPLFLSTYCACIQIYREKIKKSRTVTLTNYVDCQAKR